MATKKDLLNIGMVACGRQAWLGFLPWIKEHPRARLAAVCDVDGTQARRAARKFGAAKQFTDWRQMLNAADLHAVIITTPPWLHAEPAVAALERGLHVLCEKPMATSEEDCRAMIAAADKSGAVLQIGFSLRFDPGYEKLASRVRCGDIGKVYQLKSEYDIYVPDLSRPPFKQFLEIGGRLNLLNSTDMGAWRITDERAGGGVFFDHGIHYTDLFRFILNDEITHVNGAAHWLMPGRPHEDHASCMVRFSNGAAAHIEASMSRWSARGEIDEGILYGETGDLRYEFDQSWYVRGYPHLYNIHARVWEYRMASLIVGAWLPLHVHYGRGQCMFKRQFDWFMNQAAGTVAPHPVFGENWAATGRDGLRAILVAKAVYASSESGDSVALED